MAAVFPRITNIGLSDGQTWQGKSILRRCIREQARGSEFLLFQNDGTTPSDSLHLFVDVGGN